MSLHQPSPDLVEQQLAALVLERLRPLSAGATVALLLLVPVSTLGRPPGMGLIVFIELLGALLFASLWLCLRFDRLRIELAHIASALAGLVVVTPALVILHASGDPMYTAYVVLVLMIVGSNILRVRWLLLLVGLVGASWAVIVWPMLEERIWRVSVPVVIAMVAAIAIAAARVRTERRVLAEGLSRRMVEINLKQTNRRLEELSRLDPLTELVNRRVLMDRLEAELPGVSQGRPLTLLLLDLDGFKFVNDQRGHAVGDDLLRAVALVLKMEARPADIAGRYGGDEFFLVLPGTDAAQSAPIAARLVEEIRHTAWESGLLVTASVGVASALPGEGPAQLLRRADAASYASKRSGGDRYTVAGGAAIATAGGAAPVDLKRYQEKLVGALEPAAAD